MKREKCRPKNKVCQVLLFFFLLSSYVQFDSSWLFSFPVCVVCCKCVCFDTRYKKSGFSLSLRKTSSSPEFGSKVGGGIVRADYREREELVWIGGGNKKQNEGASCFFCKTLSTFVLVGV